MSNELFDAIKAGVDIYIEDERRHALVLRAEVARIRFAPQLTEYDVKLVSALESGARAIELQVGILTESGYAWLQGPH